MKSFSDITAIDTDRLLEVKVSLVTHHNATYQFKINNNLVQAENTVHYFDLLDSLAFECNTTSGAVEIAKITINGHEIMPVYQHLSNPKTSWVTGNWTLFVPSPFYPWYHEITGQGWTA